MNVILYLSRKCVLRVAARHNSSGIDAISGCSVINAMGKQRLSRKKKTINTLNRTVMNACE